MNIICYGASVTAQKEAAGYYHVLKSLFKNSSNINLERVSFAASTFDQAGFAFSREIERLKQKPDLCIIDWLTPGSIKFNVDKINALSKYLLNLGCLPLWVNFPRSDDLDNKRECYQQVASHCLTYHIPFLDLSNDAGFLSNSPEFYLRDKVHTTPEGGVLYAQVIKNKLDAINIKELFNNAILKPINSSLIVPSLNDVSCSLLPKLNSVLLKFDVIESIQFELFFLATIGPYTPLLKIDILNVLENTGETITVNCLDKWSHYDREKCIKVLLKKINAGKYEVRISPLNEAAIELVDIKKPVNRDIYKEGNPLTLPIQKISSNVILNDFLVEEINV